MEIRLLQQQTKLLSNELTGENRYTQRHILLFDGIKEDHSENCTMTIDSIINQYMDLPDIPKIRRFQRKGTWICV